MSINVLPTRVPCYPEGVKGPKLNYEDVCQFFFYDWDFRSVDVFKHKFEIFFQWVCFKGSPVYPIFLV